MLARIIMPPRWPVRSVGARSFRSADPPHAPRRFGFILRPVPPPVARGPGRLRAVPARRAVQQHRPPFQIVATTKAAIQRSCHHEQELLTQANEALDAITINSDRSDHATRNSVTGACLPPSIIWLGRAVKVVHAAAYASRRGSTVDCAPFAGGAGF